MTIKIEFTCEVCKKVYQGKSDGITYHMEGYNISEVDACGDSATYHFELVDPIQSRHHICSHCLHGLANLLKDSEHYGFNEYERENDFLIEEN